jgi:CDP-6-deoxy-D-xylo-4-hexulose-3-dehydrase
MTIGIRISGIKKRKALQELKEVIRRYICETNSEFIPGKSKIPISAPSFGWEEVLEAIDSMLSTRVTMGEKVAKYEEMFADYIGMKHAVMVNSGSSANLLAMAVLTNPVVKNHIKNGCEVIVPAVTWSTTVFPVINVGAIPVLTDIDLNTYNINPEDARKAVNRKSEAIIPVHLLGNPCDMDKIMKLAKENDLRVVEDACEAHGAEINGRKVGSFGDLSTFSFFFSHHITTIEGGMLLTNNEEYAEVAKSLRAHGWVRELKHKEKLAKLYPHIDKRFLFVNIGFNMRPTEIQGAFGIHQLKKLEDFIKIRRENARFFTRELSEFSDYLLLPEERPNTRHVWFGYPITVKERAGFTREELVSFLERGGIETRPIMAGNLAEQPALNLYRHKVVGRLNNARIVMRNSFFFGNHQGIGKEEREYIVSRISEFIKRVKK